MYFRKYAFFAFLFIFILGATPAAATNAVDFRRCSGVLQDEVIDVAAERKALVDLVKEKRVPAFIKRVNGVEIPVVLVSQATEAALLPYFSRSVGTQLMVRQGWPNNHGSLRVSENLIDAFVAGKRQHGEIHETGLSWKKLHDSLVFLDNIADAIIEVSYAVSASELAAFEFYQFARRAALFRVVFGMGDMGIYQKFDNVLNARDVCFDFSKCNHLAAQAAELAQRAAGLEKEIFAGAAPDPAGKSEFLAAARARLMQTNPYDVAAFSEKLLTTGRPGEILSRIVPAGVAERKRQLLANYWVGLVATQEVQRVHASLGISSNTTDGDWTGKHVTAVLIYMSNPARGAEFTGATLNFSINGYSFSSNGGVRIE